MNSQRRIQLKTALLLPATITGLAACQQQERFFDLEWDEEVKLLDGRIITVHIKHRYMRIDGRFYGYSDISVPIDSTLTLDTGSSAGTVVQYFKGFQTSFLDQHQGIWYGVLRGKYYPGSRETPGQDWGEMEGPSAQWAIKLVEGKWQPISMSRLPASFLKENIYHFPSPASSYQQFNGKKITLADKTDLRIKFPRNDVDTLQRPNAYSAKRPDTLLPSDSSSKENTK